MIRLRLVLGLCAACALSMAGLQPRPLHAASAVPSVSIRHVNALNFGVVVGDFNGDGYVDLVATEPWTDGPPYMTIALGQSGGGFGAATRIACVCRPLAAADFNGDGKLDLVVEEMPEPDVDVLALQGNGDGTFTRPLNSVSRVAQPYSVYFGLAADMNGDGKQDVVLAVDADGTNPKILVVPGNGDFTFPYPTPYQLTASAYPNGGALRDLNGDGRIDIVVANHDGDSVSVFLNQGRSTSPPRRSRLARRRTT